MWVEQRMEKTDKQTRMHARMWMPLVSSIKRLESESVRTPRCVRKCMRVPARLRLWAHPNGMITNPQTHQRGLEKRGSTKKRERENAKLKYSAPSEEKIKQARFSSASPEKEKGRERERERERKKTEQRQNRRQTTNKWTRKRDSTRVRWY